MRKYGFVCFCQSVSLSVCHAPRPARCSFGGCILNKYCVTVYRSILNLFSPVFGQPLPYRGTKRLPISIARWRHNFRDIASKIAKCPKISGKVCAHNYYRHIEIDKIPLQ